MSIPIILASDDRFAIGAAVLIRSILDSTSSPLRFVYLHNGLSQENRRRVSSLIEGENQVEFVDVDEALAALPTPFQDTIYNRMNYARLLAPSLVSEDRAIYLDSDIVVKEDLRKLYEWDLCGRPLAAVRDCCIEQQVRRRKHQYEYFRDICGEDRITDYFNSGVILFDLKEFRRRHLAEEVMKVIQSGKLLRYADQCALNAVLVGDYQILPDRWNVMVTQRFFPHDFLQPAERRRAVSQAYADPAVYHFVGEKPWKPFPVPYRREFNKVLARTPYTDSRIRLSSLSWQEKMTLANGWRRHAVSLRVRKQEVSFKLMGIPIVNWSGKAA